MAWHCCNHNHYRTISFKIRTFNYHVFFSSPSSLNLALASIRTHRIFWTAQAYSLPKVTSSSIRLNGGIKSTSFKQSVSGSLSNKETELDSQHCQTFNSRRTAVSCQDSHIWEKFIKLYPISIPSGISLCHPQNIAYCTEGSKKLLAASFKIVSIPSRRTSALSNCKRATQSVLRPTQCEEACHTKSYLFQEALSHFLHIYWLFLKGKFNDGTKQCRLWIKALHILL